MESTDTRRPSAEKEKEARAQEGQEDSQADLAKEMEKVKVHVGRAEDLICSLSARKGRDEEKEKESGVLSLRKERKVVSMVRASPESMEKVKVRCAIMNGKETAKSGAQMNGTVSPNGVMMAGTGRRMPAKGGKAMTGMETASSNRAHNSNKAGPSNNHNNNNSKAVNNSSWKVSVCVICKICPKFQRVMCQETPEGEPRAE